jgi:cytochrome c oxidase accessory protein FixG
MIDEHTLTVTYRSWRGEKRGSHKKGESWEGRGDCVDCKACQAVCPTGIDIRDGLQLECIGCGLCIDACDEIMDKVERPRGLIAFDTDARQHAARRGETGPRRHHLLRPRTFIYATALILALAVMATGLMMRHTQELSVLPDRNPLFVVLTSGQIRNAYTLKIANHYPDSRRFVVELADLPGAALRIAGPQEQSLDDEEVAVTVKGDSVGTFRAYVQAPRELTKNGEAGFAFILHAKDESEVTRTETSFRAPAR